jgi:hypothetical protein
VNNLLLDQADRQVLQDPEKPDPDLFYARYCDDMIIVHPDKEKCHSAFERYRTALSSLNLLPHHPLKVEKYDKDFWDKKSKSPYKWAAKDNAAAVPWVSFLGYQLRYDGLIRIRPSSVEKELKKQVEQANNILKYVCPKQKSTNSSEKSYSPGTRRSKDQILYRLHQRLISMSVGRKQIGTPPDAPSVFCWCVGFKELKGRRIVCSQLKQLDRGRERQLRRVKRHLTDLDIPSNANANSHHDRLKYRGHPFSYYSLNCSTNAPCSGVANPSCNTDST